MPIMTGYYAHNHGRSFWRWFAIGCGLPFFSLFMVAGVVHRNQRCQRLADPVKAAALAEAVAELQLSPWLGGRKPWPGRESF